MRKSNHGNRNIRVTVRLTNAEREFVTSGAEACGLSISSFVRRLSLGQRVTAKADLRLAGELRRLGGLMKHIHNETNGAYSEKTALCLKEIAACLRALGMPLPVRGGDRG